ncbi:YggT family protein [Candidatus Saccharibacteria bacterium]|nr:YggT family protein [Candidatus Saccharibacteria bacterium]
MAKQKPSDGTLVLLKVSRGVTYFAYFYAVVASVFLSIGFLLQLFGANPSAGFSQFIYKGAYEFLKPFRNIFPGHQVSDTSYFNSAALFAIFIYFLVAVAIHSLIAYLTSKMVKHEAELQEDLDSPTAK